MRSFAYPSILRGARTVMSEHDGIGVLPRTQLPHRRRLGQIGHS